MFASLTVQVVNPSPAAAAAPYSVNADDYTADIILDGSTTALKSPFSDGTAARIRILHPTSFNKPSGGYRMVFDLHGTGANRCADQPYLGRSELAAQGYVVVSFNQRGYSSTTGTTWTKANCASQQGQAAGQQAEAAGGIDDTGTTYGGYRDLLDISEILNWVRDNYTWADPDGGGGPLLGCSSACVDENHVGVMGFSQGGMRTMMLGMPNPSPATGTSCTTYWDCRIKAIVPLAHGNGQADNIAAISNNGAGEAVPGQFPPYTFGFNGMASWANDGHMDPSYWRAMSEASAAAFTPKTNRTATIAAGSLSTLTVSAPPYFAPSDEGSKVNVPGAGASGVMLASKINTVNSTGTQATLITAASGAVSNVAATWLSPPGNQTDTGAMSAAGTTLTISGSPAFAAEDVGKEIMVAGAGPSGATLRSHITSVTDSTHAVLFNAATCAGGCSSKRVRWGSLAVWNRSVNLISDDSAVDAVANWGVPTLFIQGWLDGESGILNQRSIEEWQKMPSTGVYSNSSNAGYFPNDVAKYLYLGSCAHGPDPCKTTGNNPRKEIQDTVLRFFDRYLNGTSTAYVRPPGSSTCATTGPCVLYTVPHKYVTTNNDVFDTAPTDAVTSSTTWPPSGVTNTTYYLHDNPAHSMSTTSGGNTANYESMVSPLSNALIADACSPPTIGSNESVYYYSPVIAENTKLLKVVANLKLSSDVPRMQIVPSLYLVDGTSYSWLSTIWFGPSQIKPYLQNMSTTQSGVVQTFQFTPGGQAWTMGPNQRLLVVFRVTSKPFYTVNNRLYHNGAGSDSSITLTTL